MTNLRLTTLLRQAGSTAPVTTPVRQTVLTLSLKAYLRPEQGNLAANYDANAATRQQTSRCQFGKKYDAKKIRNMQPSHGRAVRRCATNFGRTCYSTWFATSSLTVPIAMNPAPLNTGPSPLRYSTSRDGSTERFPTAANIPNAAPGISALLIKRHSGRNSLF
jgi:hypothetical protein